MSPVIDAYLHRYRSHRDKIQPVKLYTVQLALCLPTQLMSLCRHESSSCRKPRLSIVHCCLLHWLAIFYRSVAGTSTRRRTRPLTSRRKSLAGLCLTEKTKQTGTVKQQVGVGRQTHTFIFYAVYLSE